MIAVDLGQSGCRISIDGKIHSSNRGKLAGESVLVSLEENFKKIDAKSEFVTLSLTGLFGYVENVQAYLELCNKYFGTKEVAVIDDGLASLAGSLAGKPGVALTLGVLGLGLATFFIAKALFGSCRYVVEDFLPRFGVASTLVDGTELAQWRQAVRPNTRTFFLESPTNPTLEVIDIAAVAEIAPQSAPSTTWRRKGTFPSTTWEREDEWTISFPSITWE